MTLDLVARPITPLTVHPTVKHRVTVATAPRRPYPAHGTEMDPARHCINRAEKTYHHSNNWDPGRKHTFSRKTNTYEQTGDRPKKELRTPTQAPNGHI